MKRPRAVEGEGDLGRLRLAGAPAAEAHLERLAGVLRGNDAAREDFEPALADQLS